MLNTALNIIKVHNKPKTLYEQLAYLSDSLDIT